MDTILLLSASLSNRLLLCHACEEEGLVVDASCEEADTLTKLRNQHYFALIVDASSLLDARDFLSVLAALPAWEGIVRVWLDSDDESRADAILAGVDVALPFPLIGRDLALLLRLMHQGQNAAPLTLEDFGLLSLLRALVLANMETSLLLSSGDLQGRIEIRNGQIAHCQLGSRRGKAALFRLLSWKSLQVQLDALPEEQTHEVPLPDSIWHDAADYLSEFRKYLHQLPEFDKPLQLHTGSQQGLPHEVISMLAYCKKGVTLESILNLLPYQPLDVLKVLCRLVSLEVLEPPITTLQTVAQDEESKALPEDVWVRPIYVVGAAQG